MLLAFSHFSPREKRTQHNTSEGDREEDVCVHKMEDTCHYIPNAIESNRIAAILTSDQAFSSASNALQRGGEKQLELVHARSLFDKLIRQHPDSRNHLHVEAEVGHSPIFESAVCNVQALDERLLNSHEKRQLNAS